MRQSWFNVLVDGNQGEHILYNTLTSALAVLDDQALLDLNDGSGEHVGELEANGFLVDEDTDETIASRETFNRVSKDTQKLTLSFVPTYQCNYACIYCYEHGNEPASKMTDEVLEATMRFIGKIYERDHFSELDVQWYGGEPTLRMDTIETLSRRLLGFCAERGIRYSAMMLSNCGLIGSEEAQILARCQIASVMPTVDCGPHLQDVRRVDRAGGSSYEKTMAGIRNLKAAGITVNPIANLDEVAMKEYPAFAKKMRDEEGLYFMPAMLKNYSGCYGKGAFCAPDFRLCTGESFAKAVHDMNVNHLGAADIAEFLAPADHFCTRQLENYFVIDYRGDIYKCDGYVDHAEHVMFNLLDDYDISSRDAADYQPWDDPFCAECVVLPLCLGACLWDRELVDEGCSCSVVKYSIDDYVKDYRNCFGPVSESLSVLVKAREV